MKKIDDIYREVLWRTNFTTNDFPYVYASGGAYGFLQTFADVYKYLCTEVIYSDSNYFLEKASANLVADVEDYYTPNDLVRLRYLELAMDGTNFYKANEFNPTFFPNSEQALVSAGSYSNPYFWPMGSINVPSSHFQVAPRPRSAVTNGIKYYYDRMPSALFSDHISAAVSTASAMVHFPQHFDYLIPLGIAVEVWGKQGVRDKFADDIQRYRQGVEDMKRLLKPRVSVGQKRMRDSREV